MAKKFKLPKRFTGTDFFWKKETASQKAEAVKNLPFAGYLPLVFGLNLLFIILIFVSQKLLPPQIPLFYGMPEGEGQLASSLFLIIPCLSAIIISVVNVIAALIVGDGFLKKTLIIATIPITFFALITTVKIFLLVGAV